MNIKVFPFGYLALFPCLLGLYTNSYVLSWASLVPPKVPNNLKVPPGEKLLLRAQGKGVQIYQCQSKTNRLSQFEWTLKAPEADLFNDKGEKIGKHYAGPSWEVNDGSKVVGQVKASANLSDSSTIPWLLLVAKFHEGNGIFDHVTSIQRLNTVGGKAPATGCNQSHRDTEVRVNYQATYYFYRAGLK